MENLNNYSIDFLEDLFRNSYNYDNKKTIKNPFQFETSSPISPFVKRWKRVRTIERRLLIAFQTKRKELLFRFSVSYVTVNTHATTFPMLLTLPFHILFLPDLSICSSIKRFSLSLSISSSFFLILCMKVSASTWRREWNLLFRIRKRKNRGAITSTLMRIKRRVYGALSCHVVWTCDAKKKKR